MSEPEHQDPGHRPRKSGRSRLPAFFLITLLLLAFAGAALLLFTRPEGSHPPEPTGRLGAKPAPPLAGPPRPAPGSQEDTGFQARQGAEDPPLSGSALSAPGDPAGQCSALAKKLHGFFLLVDQQEYLEQFVLNRPSQEHFIDLADRLLTNPPVVSREADDLYTILQNMAHFFRVIGKENILLIKTILDRERDQIEEVAADLYLWAIAEGCQEAILPFSPPLDGVYEYAGFFLNTMGGRSYLFRRDSRSRLLVNYYAVLIVDRTNALGINRHGIDIGQHIPQLIEEIDSSTQLINKEHYLDRLYQLQERLPHSNDTAR